MEELFLYWTDIDLLCNSVKNRSKRINFVA